MQLLKYPLHLRAPTYYFAYIAASLKLPFFFLSRVKPVNCPVPKIARLAKPTLLYFYNEVILPQLDSIKVIFFIMRLPNFEPQF